jgi:hypothetical protein
MAYFIFQKNSDNLEGTFYKIAENKNDLDSLNINKDDYKIIEDSQSNFDAVKYGIKNCIGYNGDTINFINVTNIFKNTFYLKQYIKNQCNSIENFLNNNLNHNQFQKWNNYKNQLFNLDLDSIQYPLNISLEQYFKDKNLPSLSPLQIP